MHEVWIGLKLAIGWALAPFVLLFGFLAAIVMFGLALKAFDAAHRLLKGKR